jgi:hypothetical protein
MRSRNVALVVPFLVAAIGLAGCAAPADDGSDGQTQDVTGGSSAIESPVAFLFESAGANVAPKCAGAMIADKFAVTAKSCAKEGLILGRAADKDGHGTRAKVIKVHAPPGADADIAVVELDRAINGTHALITHMPLRGGYAVNAFAATDGKGLFAPDKNEASSVAGTMVEETATHGSIVPAKGSAICDGDIGAPVCSSTGGKIPGLGYTLYGTCGLSGLVVSRAVAAAPAAAAPGAGAPGADPVAAKCSGGAWKVAQLGQYADFLATFAPKAFEPWFIDKPFLRSYPYYAPDGLWGYKTKGTIKACTLDATTLAPIAPGAMSAKLGAKVSFASMEKNAAAWGRVGVAPKSAPTDMRWLPAKPLATAGGNAFDAKFEGIVSAEAAGDYVVAFRASANGGESWTPCDTDGIANGFSVDKALSLKVADPNGPSAPGSTPPSTTPQDSPPATSANEGSYSDPPASAGESSADGPVVTNPEDRAPKKKATDSQGCSMSSAPARDLGGSSLPVAGILFGLAALARRRRAIRGSTPQAPFAALRSGGSSP